MNIYLEDGENNSIDITDIKDAGERSLAAAIVADWIQGRIHHLAVEAEPVDVDADAALDALRARVREMAERFVRGNPPRLPPATFG